MVSTSCERICIKFQCNMATLHIHCQYQEEKQTACNRITRHKLTLTQLFGNVLQTYYSSTQDYLVLYPKKWMKLNTELFIHFSQKDVFNTYNSASSNRHNPHKSVTWKLLYFYLINTSSPTVIPCI